MLRFDRYLAAGARAIDLATGSHVELVRTKEPRVETTVFSSRDGRSLIDLDVSAGTRVEVWERWTPTPRPPQSLPALVDFTELLECAREGAPRPFDVGGDRRHAAYTRRVLARESRIRGWIPIAVEVLASIAGAQVRKAPEWMADRSLVIFASAPELSGEALLALLKLARRDPRPHVLVRCPAQEDAADHWRRHHMTSARSVLHEVVDRLRSSEEGDAGAADLSSEARARWALMLEESAAGDQRDSRALDLARVLIAREQPFEARALVTTVKSDTSTTRSRAETLTEGIDQRARVRAGGGLGPPSGVSGAKGWEMVDDFVGVLQMCQDIEDEQTALARVGAFLRERLQASSVAFVAREGTCPRIVARVGSTIAGLDLAWRTIETGVPIAPSSLDGPAESACPVRHAAEVIGALWCRWTAGMPVAGPHAATLLGIAAAAAAPSLRLAMARRAPAVSQTNPVPEMVGVSAIVASVRESIVRAAASPFPVVIEGESGSGKELAARAIHSRSARRDRRFCAINCAALVDDLVETELFGHVRGAFTGAAGDRPGVFEEAHGGTLFLDEVAELGARVQAKLLRVLQEGELRRLGENIVRKVDVRVVAATNRPLAKEVAAGTFRSDLWYRLDVVRITLPPLRERLEDLPSLVGHLWQSLAARTGSRAALSSATVASLAAYDWPGNIRELQNVLASMLVATPRAGLIGPSALPSHIGRAAALQRSATLADARRQFDERYVRAALARSGGRTSSAARELGLSRQGLAKLMGRLGIGEAEKESGKEAGKEMSAAANIQ